MSVGVVVVRRYGLLDLIEINFIDCLYLFRYHFVDHTQTPPQRERKKNHFLLSLFAFTHNQIIPQIIASSSSFVANGLFVSC